MGLINSMPASWRLTIKRATTAPVIDPLPDSPAILISNNLVPILDASSKQIYRLFPEKKQTTPTAKVKLAAKYSNMDIDWKSVYSLSFHTTLESKLEEFQFKILNRIVFTNEKLFRFGMADSPSCAFCQTEVESVEHLLFSCRVSSSFWKHVLSWLRHYNISVDNLKEKMSFLVSSILQRIFSCLTIICFWDIYPRKYQNDILSLQGFIAGIRRFYNIALHIAKKRDKLNNHFRKWEK